MELISPFLHFHFKNIPKIEQQNFALKKVKNERVLERFVLTRILC